MNAQSPDDLPPGGPGRDLDAEALSRVLDGIALDADADDAERAAQSRAEDDVAALKRAFALMGDALAEPVAAADSPDAVVLPFAARLRRRAPILAAAASLIAVVGLGTVLVNDTDLGGSDDESSSAAQQPADAAAAGAAPEAAPAPNASMDMRNGQTYAERSGALSGETAAGAPAAAKSAADKAAPAEEADSAGTAATKTDTKAASARPALDVVVSCNRGVFIGRVLSVTPSGTRYTLRVAITDWISPSSGAATREFTVGRSYANTPDGRIDLKLGQEWLFVVPQSQARAVRTFAGPDYSEAREQVAAAQERTAGDDC